MDDVEFTERDGALVVRPHLARLDARAAPAFRAAVGDRVAGRKTVVLDLAEVGFVDSSGLGALVSGLKRVGPGGTLRLAAVAEPVRALLALTRLDKIFPVHATVEEALAAD